MRDGAGTMTAPGWKSTFSPFNPPVSQNTRLRNAAFSREKMGNNLKEKVCLRSREDGEQTQGHDRDKEMLGEQLPPSAEWQKSCQQPSSCQPSPSSGVKEQRLCHSSESEPLPTDQLHKARLNMAQATSRGMALASTLIQ